MQKIALSLSFWSQICQSQVGGHYHLSHAGCGQTTCPGSADGHANSCAQFQNQTAAVTTGSGGAGVCSMCSMFIMCSSGCRHFVCCACTCERSTPILVYLAHARQESAAAAIHLWGVSRVIVGLSVHVFHGEKTLCTGACF